MLSFFHPIVREKERKKERKPAFDWHSLFNAAYWVTGIMISDGNFP